MSWPGWAWTRGYILHHHTTLLHSVNTASFVTLLNGIYQQYLHISHSVISLSSSHTRTQRDKQVLIRQQVIFCICYITAGRQCSSDVMVSVARKLSLLSASSSQCLLQPGCQTANNETAEWRASYHHHHHHHTAAGEPCTVLSRQPRHGYQGLVSH